jgi:GR25 family glycosyltransferase involved in LPS biosynthesis
VQLRPSGAIREPNGVVSNVEIETGVSSPSSPWAFFDKIYCISLDEREDRRQEARIQFDNVGLADRVEFVIVKKHPADNEQGIHESHMECMRKGIRADARTMIIFEDDIVFDRFSVGVLADCVRFLSTTSSWKIFFFGCLCSGSQKTENKSVLKVRYRSLTHAYVVRRSFAETLLGTPWRSIPYDVLLCNLAGDYYAAYPSFAFQSNARTDNMRKRKVDRFRRLCGGLLKIQKMNEWYHRNRLAVIAIHIFLIMILLLVAWS